MNLNQQQEAAVLHYGTPQVIIAGAGTGKTTVMIEKISYLINSGKHSADQILALTFTNKAANEMKERFKSKHPTDSQPTFGTFHSFCLRFLKASEWLNSIGIKPGFTIIDSQQQRELVTQLSKNTPSLGRKPKDILSQISKIKQLPHHMHSEALSSAASDIQAIFKPYNTALRDRNCLDFDDLLLFTYQILATQPEALEKIQSKFKFIIIDEYQDTNQIQNDISILLAKSHENICVVGDFDQTIYSWRGAKIENLLSFNHIFPTAIVQKLEHNYRSTKEILTTANQLIECNSNRQPKKLISDRVSNNVPEQIICFDEREEAETIALKIKKLVNDNRYQLNDFAILYRTNQQSRAIEECLTFHNIPHHIVGTTPFYQRIEVKSAIAFLQCLHNLNQPVWFEKAMLTPSRGIGKTSLEKIIEFTIKHKCTIEEALTHPECPLQNRFVSIIETFIKSIKDINSENISISEKLDKILTAVNFDQHLRKLENTQDRYDNIQELKSKLKDIKSLENFLEDITLFQGSDEDNSTGKVRCLTLHLAKGLEFPVVFIPGFEERLLPLHNSESIEEERRLAYVGITRGKDKVILLSTYKRTLLGEDWYHNPSKFTKEIKDSIKVFLTEKADHMGRAIRFKLENENINFDVIQSQKPKRNTIQATQATFDIFNVGDVISHATLGTGIIEKTSGTGDSLMYDISFHSGKKKLMAKFAKLQRQ